MRCFSKWKHPNTPPESCCQPRIHPELSDKAETRGDATSRPSNHGGLGWKGF